MIPTRLKEIEELANAATDGPWHVPEMHDKSILVCGVNGNVIADCKNNSTGRDEPNAAFITASRTLVPELVAEIRRLREVLGFYADEEHYLMIDTVYEDQGQRARDAIGGV